MPPQRRLPEPWPHVDDGVGDRGLKGGLLCWCGASCPGKGLAGAAEAAPGKGLAGGTCFVPLLFVVLAVVLLWLPRASILPRFTSAALLGVAVGAALTVRALVKW